VLAAGDVNENSILGHTDVVAPLGCYAHGLAATRMGWRLGEWMGTTYRLPHVLATG
jgi:hypothetical protein